MKSSWIELGAVCRWSTGDEAPMRVLLHDAGVVMYDAWWQHRNRWGMAKLSELKGKQISYYAVPEDTLLEKATYLRTEPLTAEEIALHRPDLPYCVGQCAGLDWPADPPESPARMAESLSTAGCAGLNRAATLDAPEIYLFPFGSQGGYKRGVRVRAGNGSAFTIDELIWHAATAQARFVGDTLPAQGIGVYRDGLNREIPAYYLWGHQSRMDTYIAEAMRRRQQSA